MARSRKRRRLARTELSEPQILAWADAYHARTGQWPRSKSGLVRDQLGESWRKIDAALRYGLRGLTGGSSRARLLAQRRGVRNLWDLPPFAIQQILAWSDNYRRRTGHWPMSKSGAVPEAPGETWRAADRALRIGIRGLPGGSSLARLLTAQRHARNLHHQPRLTIGRILTLADGHHRRTGSWPTSKSGTVREAPGENWGAVNIALQCGRRGLPAGSSLARLLAARRDVRNPKDLPRLTCRQVLAWARAHRRRTGGWPTATSGPIPEAPGETWGPVRSALLGGYRGLPVGLTLGRLIGARQSVPRGSSRPQLTLSRVLAWADAHHRCTGNWPRARTIPGPKAHGETWRTIDQALRTGQRGLTGGLSLARLLAEQRDVRSRHYAPLLRRRGILIWARALRNRASLPRLSVARVLAWAREHRRRMDSWPDRDSGPVTGVAGETWLAIDLALRFGHRGLPGGSSLTHLVGPRG
jgi:hypothetical protein